MNKMSKGKTTRNSKVKFDGNFLLILILTGLFISGCEKVIDVDLNEASPALVIQGNLSSDQKVAEVKLTMTTSYFDTLSPEKVSGAIVSLEDDNGKKIVLKETLKGVYAAFSLRPVYDTKYRLTVETKDKTYQAESVLNPPVTIDSVTWEYDEGSSFFDAGYYLNVWFFDPPSIQNYYRIQVYRNGLHKRSMDDLIVFNDRYVDGNKVEISLFNDPYYLNDTVLLQLVSLDKNAYDYFSTLSELINTNPGSAAPANPNTNFSNGALGYFSAWSSDTLEVIIRE
jgi:hypothetical protein